ncbi:MAG TPA: hypothetical protein VJH37_02855 [Candidatus Nanoarchaeia archaeon]|nr:hypothetical protein [Candidatus Nanoarchaeia archaeon]
MKKDNSLIIGVIGGIILIGGVIWSIAEAVKGPPYSLALMLATIGVVVGIISIVFSMRDQQWIIL